ncbi:MAG TPA: DUF2203 domain-containing protein [Verrucomicrobiales bacterium]|nr:DUF2203 domain-containing protein [Verrucomicrobiales bacterium]
MSHQFAHHYTRDQARALLPQLRTWLAEIQSLRAELAKYGQRLDSLMSAGDDAGGVSVNANARAVARLHLLSKEFSSRDIFIKDPDRGLVDFPAIIGGREVFLCWELDEEDVEFWHDIDAGFAGRERLAS